MKKTLLFAAAALCVAAPYSFAAENADQPGQPPAADKAPPHRVEKRIRVVSDGKGVQVFHGDEKDLPKEVVTFLGVETNPVDPALNAQLGLKRGIGLVVRRVVPDSPAAAVLKEHDVLTRLNDQWLVDQHQLSVLIQTYNEGDEVSLAVVRGGKEQTLKAKLSKQERPKLGMFKMAGPGAGNLQWAQSIPAFGGDREALHEHLRALQELRGSTGQRDVIINRSSSGGAPGPRISIMRMPKAVMIFKDGNGAVELKNEDGKQLLEVRDPKEKVTFAGEVTTPEQRAKLTPEVRARLELVEAKDVLDFVPEGDLDIGTGEAVPAAERITARRSNAALGNPVMRL